MHESINERRKKPAVVRFEEPSEVERLDRLAPSDEIKEIYKVYWSRKHDQIVAKVLVKRADDERDNRKRYSDLLLKVPVRQLKDRKASLFIDFMSELIKDKIRRQRDKLSKRK